jgi:hypothetical protein
MKKPFSRMAPTKHLDEARKALADGYKPDLNPMKTVWGRVSDARKHLKEIEAESHEYIAARGLMREVLLRERKIKNVCIGIEHHLMIKQREMLADELEQHSHKRGILVEIELSGPDKTSIRLMCPLLREVSIDRIVNETNLFTYLKKAGFKQVVLGDNEEYIFTYSFEKS